MVSGCSNQQCRIFGGLCFLFLYWRFFLTPSSHTGLWQQQVKWDFSCLSVSPLAWRADSTRQPASPVTALKWKHSSFLSTLLISWLVCGFDVVTFIDSVCKNQQSKFQPIKCTNKQESVFSLFSRKWDDLLSLDMFSLKLAFWHLLRRSTSEGRQPLRWFKTLKIFRTTLLVLPMKRCWIVHLSNGFTTPQLLYIFFNYLLSNELSRDLKVGLKLDLNIFCH